jgi:hypothetical protein
MPRHRSGVSSPGRGDSQSLNGLPSAVRVVKVRTSPGPKGTPRSGKGVPSNPAAAARMGEQEAKNPRK